MLTLRTNLVFEMRKYRTGLEVNWEIWRTGRRICWHCIPWGQNQQNSFGSWYLKVVDLLTSQCVEAMTVLLNFLFLGNEIVWHLDILGSTWVYSLMLTGTPISSVTILKNFSLLPSYEGKSPANLLYSLLIQTLAANSLTSGGISVGNKCIIVWVWDKVCREAKSELQGWI